MRIVHALGALVAGGAERFVAELLEALAARGHEVGLLRLSPRVDAVGRTWEADLCRVGADQRSGPTTRVGLRSVLAYARALRELEPDVLHLHNLNVEAAHLLAAPLRPHGSVTVRTIHNTELDPPLSARLGFRLNRVDATVFCSEASRRRNASRFGGRRSVIPNGVRFDWPLRDEADRSALRRKLGLEDGVRHFLAVGRMEAPPERRPQKAHDVLIRAWKHFEASGPPAVLHLLGDGAGRGGLETLAAGARGIRFHGVRADVRDWMLATDVFVMPSRWEGMPIAALEAIGSGMRCVFSDLPELRDLEPLSACWCAAEDAQALADCLARVLPEVDVPSAGTVRAYRREHGIDRCAERHLELYTGLRAAGGREQATC